MLGILFNDWQNARRYNTVGPTEIVINLWAAMSVENMKGGWHGITLKGQGNGLFEFLQFFGQGKISLSCRGGI